MHPHPQTPVSLHTLVPTMFMGVGRGRVFLAAQNSNSKSCPNFHEGLFLATKTSKSKSWPNFPGWGVFLQTQNSKLQVLTKFSLGGIFLTNFRPKLSKSSMKSPGRWRSLCQENGILDKMSQKFSKARSYITDSLSRITCGEISRKIKTRRNEIIYSLIFIKINSVQLLLDPKIMLLTNDINW